MKFARKSGLSSASGKKKKKKKEKVLEIEVEKLSLKFRKKSIKKTNTSFQKFVVSLLSLFSMACKEKKSDRTV